MCGIAGIVAMYGRGPSSQEIASMCAALSRRGPDEEAVYVDRDAGLGLRRLSIIGLEPGRQPVRNEDGSVVVVMNGEIYNYRELRRSLERLGHVFSSRTDTETIAHLYEEIGPACVSELRGMFAFGLWDARIRRLLLARDRIGIKPLYYATTQGRLVFGSELKAILELPEIRRQLNWRSLDHLFTTTTTPAAESIVAGVHKLEPGHTLTVTVGGAPQIERYWRVRFEPDRKRSADETAEALRSLLAEAVETHLVSDVPVGAFLSGGVDSSTVVALMARCLASSLRTYSIGFSDDRFDESRQAGALADRLGTRHEELILGPDLGSFLEDFAWHMDEPFGDSSAIPTYMVSRLAARHLKVVLSGDGGDELFAGYDRYRVEERERAREAHLPRPLRRLLGVAGALLPEGARGRNYLRHIALEDVRRYLDSGALFRADSRRRLFRPEALECIRKEAAPAVADRCPGPAGVHWLSRLQQMDLEGYLPLDVLTKVDRMSMANSLEVRVPLLDHKLVEFAATIPPELLLRRGESKYVLKRAVAGLVPQEVLERPKRGFAVPLAAWFRGQLGDLLQSLLLSPDSRSREWLDPTYVGRVVAMHMRGRPLDAQLWTLVSFELWCRRFLGSPARSRGMVAASTVGTAVAVVSQ